MRLVDYLDKGASLAPDAPCLTTDREVRTYAEVRELSSRIAAALAGQGVGPGDKVAILVGAEGPGLSEKAMRASDIRVRIPMSRGTDSLNVATAAALAYYERAKLAR